MKLSALLVLSAAVIAVPRVGTAQARADSGHTCQDCRRAAQVIEAGHPANRADWAWSTIVGCPGVFGAMMSTALHRLEHATEPEAFDRFLAAAFVLRDGQVFETAAKIAQNPAASGTARAAAIATLVASVSDDYVVRLADLSRVPSGELCPLTLVASAHSSATATAMPRDANERARLLGEALLDDKTLPAIVRTAADCLARAARYAQQRERG